VTQKKVKKQNFGPTYRQFLLFSISSLSRKSGVPIIPAREKFFARKRIEKKRKASPFSITIPNNIEKSKYNWKKQHSVVFTITYLRSFSFT